MNGTEFEILFKNVFGNIFILSTIFKHIHNTEWIKYDHHLQIHPNNRIKFKNIHSLELMIQNKQYQLIKDKLIHNDHIEITEESIKSLFEQFKQSQQQQQQQDNDEIKSTIYLLLKYKKEIIIEMDPIKLVIDNGNCIELFNIIINELTCNQLEITTSTIEYTILNSTPEILQQLLKSTSTDISTIKNKSIKLASENLDNNIKMIDFILENEHLYSLPSSTDNQYEFIETNQLLSIYNDETKNKLMKLGIIKRLDRDIMNMLLYEWDIEQPLEKLVTLVNVHLNCSGNSQKLSTFKNQFELIMEQQQQQQFNTEHTLKEIQKLVIIHYKPTKLYQQYIIKYQKSIDEYHNDNHKTNLNDNGNTLDLYRFLSLREDEDPISILDFKLSKFIEIPNILKLFHYEGTIITIDNESTVNWIISNENEFLNKVIGSTDFKIQFSTMELTNYALSNNKFSNLLSQKSLVNKIENYYLNHYYYSISNCNLTNLKYIDKINNGEILFLSSDKFELPNSKDEILSLFQYFKESNFKNLLLVSINSLFIKLFGHQTINFLPMDFKFNLSTIDDFNSLLFDSIYNYNFKLIQFYLNNIDEIKGDDYGNNLVILQDKFLFDGNLEICHFNNGLKVDEVISIINILLSKIKQYSKPSTDIKTLANYLFQTLIQIRGISMEKIESTIQLFESNSIPIPHSIYHSFYYLNCKSPKFIKYILSRPGIVEYLDNTDWVYTVDPNNTNTTSSTTSIVGFDLKKYLNPTIFDFNTILKTNFETLLNMLMDQLSIENIDKLNGEHIVKNFYLNSLNLDLVFLLDIKRFDLFFKQLKKYKSTIPTFKLLSTTIQTATTLLFDHHDNQLLLKFKNKYC